MLPVDSHPSMLTPPAGNDGAWFRAVQVYHLYTGEYIDPNPSLGWYWRSSSLYYPPRPYSGDPPHFYKKDA